MVKHVTQATIYDAVPVVYTQDEADAIVASYPEHEREARAKGIPQLGSGRVFPIAYERIECEPKDIPGQWAIINGIDFGWDHPTAAVQLVHDRDGDVLYVTKTHRVSQATPVHHASTLRHWGDYPWAWPHDGLQHDKQSGVQMAEAYRTEGINMLHERATFEDGSSGVEAGVQELLDYMLSGRFFVFEGLNDWRDEFSLYHRQDGVIVKEFNDLLDATRYAFMMRRHAEVKSGRRREYVGPKVLV